MYDVVSYLDGQRIIIMSGLSREEAEEEASRYENRWGEAVGVEEVKR